MADPQARFFLEEEARALACEWIDEGDFDQASELPGVALSEYPDEHLLFKAP